MPDSKSHLNAYGFLGAFAAITSAVAWSVTKSKEDSCLSNYDNLQYYHSVGVVAGVVVCVASIFAIANLLRNITPLLVYVGAAVMAVCGGVLGYAAYYTFGKPCVPTLGIDWRLGDRNIFSDPLDGKMIGVFVLNILGCLMLLSAAANFSRRA